MNYFIWNINPNIFEFEYIKLTWYGLFFVGSFFLSLLFLKYLYKRESKDIHSLDNLLIYILFGTIIGARIVHCFIYEPFYYINNPIEIFQIWKGGLASHGGLIGVFISTYIFSKKYNESFFWLISRIAIPGALVAFFIRIGNFFNSEIIGIPTDKPWAIIFSKFDMIPRHPVQLYEAFSYLILFFILLLLYKNISFNLSTRIIPGIFLIYIFSVRFILEYVKLPQSDLIFFSPLSMGQILSIPFIIIGTLLLFLKIR